MTESEWDRLSWDRKSFLLLQKIAPFYYLEDGHLMKNGVHAYVDPQALSIAAESHIRLRNLKSEYIRELTKLLIGDNTPDQGDLWTFVTATPSERCLAAYKCLEELK
jgi:hypothetical protein